MYDSHDNFVLQSLVAYKSVILYEDCNYNASFRGPLVVAYGVNFPWYLPRYRYKRRPFQYVFAPRQDLDFAIHNPLAKKTDNSAVVSREPDETELRKHKAEEYRLNYARWTYLGQKR